MIDALGRLDSVVVVVVETRKDLGHIVLLVTVRDGDVTTERRAAGSLNQSGTLL